MLEELDGVLLVEGGELWVATADDRLEVGWTHCMGQHFKVLGHRGLGGALTCQDTRTTIAITSTTNRYTATLGCEGTIW